MSLRDSLLLTSSHHHSRLVGVVKLSRSRHCNDGLLDFTHSLATLLVVLTSGVSALTFLIVAALVRALHASQSSCFGYGIGPSCISLVLPVIPGLHGIESNIAGLVVRSGSGSVLFVVRATAFRHCTGATGLVEALEPVIVPLVIVKQEPR